jgi:hypothetical protein
MAAALTNVCFWYKADITIVLNQCPLLGVKRTLPKRPLMSAFDPKRTWQP